MKSLKCIVTISTTGNLAHLRKNVFFLHEDSEICKYGKLCERMLCMFKHEEIEENCENVERYETLYSVNDETSAIEEVNDVNEDEPIKIVDIVDEDDAEKGNDTTFINPSQTDKLLSAKPKVFKCEICDFECSRKNLLDDHKGAAHNWCTLCYSSFKSQEKLNNHKKKKHTDKSMLTGLNIL
jgi:hypothetical protein